MTKFMAGLWMVCILGAMSLLYMVRYKTQYTQEEIASIQQRIAEEREATHVLKAEWAYLTRPERLQQLTGQLQDMQPMTQDRIIAIQDIPLQEGSTETASQTAAVPTNPTTDTPAAASPLAPLPAAPATAPTPVKAVPVMLQVPTAPAKTQPAALSPSSPKPISAHTPRKADTGASTKTPAETSAMANRTLKAAPTQLPKPRLAPSPAPVIPAAQPEAVTLPSWDSLIPEGVE